jgi:anti-anti-sigma factor
MTIQMLGDASVFHCSGRITAGEEERLRKAVRSRSRVRTVVLDFADISAIDAAGLGMLASLRAWSKDAGIELKLMNLNPRVEGVLQLTNLQSALEICSVREMMDLLCRARSLSRFGETAAVAVA